jgi:flagellar biosynthetic protein FliR
MPAIGDLAGMLGGFAIPGMLISCRLGAAFALLPGLGEAEIPAPIRAGLALALTALLTPLLAPDFPAKFRPEDISPIMLAGAVICEVLTGLLIGSLARIVVSSLPMAGQIIALLSGVSSILQPDQALGAQNSVIGRLFSLIVPVLMFQTGLFQVPLRALAYSFTILPPGTLVAPDLALELVLRATGAAMTASLGLAAPFIALSLLWQIALAVLSRMVPQLQLYFAALPGQVLGGLALLALLASAMLATATTLIRDGFLVLPR